MQIRGATAGGERALKITIRYFAVLRERRGAAVDLVDLPGGSDVATALATIAKQHPAVAGLLPRVQVAVNQVVVVATTPLTDGDELALIPPVSGGSAPRRIALCDAPLALAEVIEVVSGPERGAVVTFTGSVRRQGQIPDVVRLEYEAYEDMAENVLGQIADEIERQLPGTRVAIHHRVGALDVGEAAVVIAAAAPHRAQAFDACRAAIERLKERAPIWKKEIGESGAAWIGLGS
jgi:molybdopterin synthase catalytic subunit